MTGDDDSGASWLYWTPQRCISKVEDLAGVIVDITCLDVLLLFIIVRHIILIIIIIDPKLTHKL